MASRAQVAVARSIVSKSLRKLSVLYNIWTLLVAFRSIGSSDFQSMTQVFSCLERGFQVRVLAWLAAITYLAIGWRITSACRTKAQQFQIWKERQGKRGMLPVAEPGTSLHEIGRAVDIVFDPDDLALVVPLARLAGIRWGGERDPVHWER